MVYKSSGTPFGSSPLMLPSVGIRCHENYIATFNSEYAIKDISGCQIVNQSNFCPVGDRIGISCGGTCMCCIMHSRKNLQEKKFTKLSYSLAAIAEMFHGIYFANVINLGCHNYNIVYVIINTRGLIFTSKSG